MVAKHFIDNPNDLPEVNHKDFNRKNNIVSNLEWCTHQYNVLYSRINGHYDHIYKSGKDNPNYGNHKLSEYYKNNPMIAKEKASRPGAQNGRAKSIILYDKNMCKIKQFSYIGECANYLIKNKLSKGKVDSVRSNISIAIKKHKLYLNYYYEYA